MEWLTTTRVRFSCSAAALAVAVLLMGGQSAASDDWWQWRGPGRNGLVTSLPLPLTGLRLAWSFPTGSPGLGGIAANRDVAVVVDHVSDEDVYRCVSLAKGEVVWECHRPMSADIDFGPCPRATPLLEDGRAYVLGAAGDLVCLDLARGAARWSRDLRRDFGHVELPTWGFCGSPLLAGGRLVANPGSRTASLVGLDPDSGELLWSSPGEPANYASFATGVLGGVRQIVGYDKTGLGGWDATTGLLLWSLPIKSHKGYLVPTPQIVVGRLLIAHSRGTELYAFGADGRILPQPVASNGRARTELSTPIVLGDRVVVPSGRLMCLSLADGLRTCWQGEDDSRFRGNGITHLVADTAGKRILAFCHDGSALLFSVGEVGLKLVDERKLHDGGWSQPAVLPDRILCRDATSVRCYVIDHSEKGSLTAARTD